MNKYEFKGTQGSWSDMSGDNASVDIVLDNLTTISIDRYHRHTGQLVGERSEMEANAKLIAAAPELLQACIEMVGQLCGEQECEEELDKGLGKPLHNKVIIMKQAIHRALNLPTV